jgi:hypothetical protein
MDPFRQILLYALYKVIPAQTRHWRVEAECSPAGLLPLVERLQTKVECAGAHGVTSLVGGSAIRKLVELDAQGAADFANEPETYVWVFNGNHNRFPSAVFSSTERAEEWIAAHRLSGTLTRYPVDVSVYDWVQERGYWRPRREEQKTPDFIANFSSAHAEHYHYGDDDKG